MDFYYRGARCRERIKLKPTPRNLRYAENLRGQILREIELGTFDYAHHFPESKRVSRLSRQPGASVTVGQALRDWLKQIEPTVQHSTFRDYRRSVDNILIPALGDIRLTALTAAQIKSLIANMDASAKRIVNLLIPLRSMLTDASEDGLINSNPMAGIAVRRRQETKHTDAVDPFSPDEVAAIISNCSGQFKNLVQFAFWTGLRTSELIALEWRHVDWSNHLILVRQAWVAGRMKVTKTKAGTREVKLLPPALDALKSQRQHTELAGDRIFHDPRTDQPYIGDKQIREWQWRPALRRAGVRYRYPYQTRHTYASTLLSVGENPAWISRQLGHGTVTMTLRVYARWIPEVDPSAGQKAALLWSTYGQPGAIND